MSWVEEDDTSRLFRVRRTLMQMMKDRGFDVDDDEIEMTKLQFTEKYGESIKRSELVIKKAKKDDPTDQIFAFFPSDQKVGIQSLRPYVTQMMQDNVAVAIVVVHQTVTPAAKGFIQEMSSKTYRLETFLEAELVVNITEHDLVPKHIPLNYVEKKELLKRYAIKEMQLPRILFSDPVARYYGLRRGQVVKIIRKSPNAGEYVTYRFVV